MSEVLATWDDFSGGHWGAVGPVKAQQNQWGGTNVLLSQDGGLAPVTASRELSFSNISHGKVWGMAWPWGADGNIYYIQQLGSSTSTASIFRFGIATTTTTAVSSIGTVNVPSTDPDWVTVGDTVYVTIYGQKTYAITTTSGGSSTLLTGTYGDAPAGRCIALYGERLMIGGISDARFGTHRNRIVFSGDDTGNDPTVRTAWESLNFFDLGADNSFIVGLYSIRDFLVAITDDQQIWVLTGVPGSTLSARRVYGFHKGSGAIEAFKPTHAGVDPSQTRIWLYDHTYRGPARFNGASFTRVNQFGIPNGDRTATAVEGAMTQIGGPDEYVMDNVRMPRVAGAETVGHRMELVRVNGVFCLVQNDVVADR